MTVDKKNTNSRIALVACLLIVCSGFFALYAPVAGISNFLPNISPAAGDEDVTLLPHKALYDLSLTKLQSGASVVGLSGEMYYKQERTCDAWSTDQRFTMQHQFPEHDPVNRVSQYVAWESLSGDQFQFSANRRENGTLIEQVRGYVRAQDGVMTEAVYTHPKGLTQELPDGFYLPTAHTIELIRKAKAGEKFFSVILFDGTDALGPVDMNVVIGSELSPDDYAAFTQAPGAQDILKDTRAWNMRFAVFTHKSKNMTMPVYEMDMILHDNGVVSRGVIDYGTFSVAQALKHAQDLPMPDCQADVIE